jgi:DNA-binding beta-propeller fold protein YncE
VAVLDTKTRRVTRWLDLRPPGFTNGLRPISVKISPVNSAIYANPYAVVLNQYGNFATVIDTATDKILGDFSIGSYAEKVRFNPTGTRLYVTDRYKDEGLPRSLKFPRETLNWSAPIRAISTSARMARRFTSPTLSDIRLR